MQGYIDDDGIINLAVRLVHDSREECMASIRAGDYIGARIIADKDSRGLVGLICDWACNDKKALLKEINETIKKVQSTEEEEWWYNNG